jgi:hypothetical protein
MPYNFDRGSPCGKLELPDVIPRKKFVMRTPPIPKM